MTTPPPDDAEPPAGADARDVLPPDEEMEARERALVARIRAGRARIEHLAALIEFTKARWPFVEAEERKRDPCAPPSTVASRVKGRIEAELRERGLDDAADTGA